MKTNRLFSMLGTLAAAAGLLMATSCEKTPEEEIKDRSVELADPTDAELFVNYGNTASITVDLVLNNITRDQLVIKAKENAGNWCAAEVSANADAVIITPGANTAAADKVAVFEVGMDAEGVVPVTIKVTSTGTETEIFVNFESEQLTEGDYGTYTFNPATAGEELTVTVRTNAEKWYLSDFNMVTDDDYNPVEWYTADKTSGRNGETCTITFSANTGTEDRMTSLMFVEDPDGYGESSIMVTQYGVPATAVTVSYYDENWEPVAVEGKTLDVEFEKEASTWDAFDFELEKDGSVSFMFVKPGTLEADTTIEGADDPWVNYSAAYGGYSIVPTANDTGKDRSTDLVILPAGDKTKELFRFKITQAGN